MIVIRRGYKRKYQVGSSGIFSKFKDFLSGFINKSKLLTPLWTLLELLGKRLDKLTPKSQQILSKLVSSTPPLAPKGSQQVTTPNLNNLIAGSGQRVIKIQDLSRRLNK